MSTKDNHWIQLTKAFNPEINEILFQQYFGAQFISMVGRHLIEQRDDDSNTSLRYHSGRQALIGEALPGHIRASLNLSDLSITLLHEDSSIHPPILLPGLDRNSAFSFLLQTLSNAGVNTSNLKNELHYDLPDHKMLHGAAFAYDHPDLIQENIAYRHNAEKILNEVISGFKDSETVRIWPHHFDTGTLIPLTYNSKGELIQSAGLGWAIPDGMVDEPYYYLSIWSKDPIEYPAKMPLLKNGKWMMPRWNGAVLKLSDILNYSTSNDQRDSVISFYKSGLQTIQELTKA